MESARIATSRIEPEPTSASRRLHRISKERLIYGGKYSKWDVTEKDVKCAVDAWRERVTLIMSIGISQMTKNYRGLERAFTRTLYMSKMERDDDVCVN